MTRRRIARAAATFVVDVVDELPAACRLVGRALLLGWALVALAATAMALGDWLAAASIGAHP